MEVAEKRERDILVTFLFYFYFLYFVIFCRLNISFYSFNIKDLIVSN